MTTHDDSYRTTVHWSTDYVEHLRTIHFTLVAACVALFILSTVKTRTDGQIAHDQIVQIREFVQNFDSRSVKRDLDQYVAKIDKNFPKISVPRNKTLQLLYSNRTVVCPMSFSDDYMLRRKHFHYPEQLFRVSTGDPASRLLPGMKLHDFKEIWDSFYETEIEVPTELSPTAYVVNHDTKEFTRESVRFANPLGDSESQEAYLNSFSPDDRNALRVKEPSFADETYYGVQCAVTRADDFTNVGLDVLIPVLESRTYKYDAQDLLLSHARPTWDWMHGSFDTAFRQLDEFTTDYQGFDIDSIEPVLRAEAKRGGESFEVGGIKFPAERAPIWGAIVVLAIQVYLWIHLRQLSPKLKPKDPGWDVAWIGVYTSISARVAMFLTTILLPAVVVLGLGLHWSFSVAGINWYSLLGGFPLSVFLGVWTWLIRPQT